MKQIYTENGAHNMVYTSEDIYDMSSAELASKLNQLEEANAILVHWKNKGLAKRYLDKYNIPYTED